MHRRPLPPYPSESCVFHAGGCFATGILLTTGVLFGSASSVQEAMDAFGLAVLVYINVLGPFGILFWFLVVHPLLWGLWALVRNTIDHKR